MEAALRSGRKLESRDRLEHNPSTVEGQARVPLDNGREDSRTERATTLGAVARSLSEVCRRFRPPDVG